MLTSRPVIFISAVSRELRTTRDLVAKTLIALGYEPKWQDIAPTETGDLRAVLRKWVDESHAVLQIVGHRYGFAPDEPDETFGQVSYTQYEALYAKAKGRKVWYILLDEHHPADCPDGEPEDLRKLQADYRIQVKAHHGLFHLSGTTLTTENIVLKLRDDLAKIRRRGKQWATVLIALLSFALGGIGWMVLKQEDTRKEVAVIQGQNAELLAAVRELPAARAREQQAAPQEDATALTARAYASLEESLKLPPGTLAKELPAFAEKLLASPDTALLDRANAAFVLKNYAEAETIALQAKDAALAAEPPSLKNAIAALSLAGQSATEQIQYKRALEHYRAAAALTGEKRDILEWAKIQNEIGYLLFLDGQYDAQSTLMHRVWQASEKAGYQEDPISLLSHHRWALALGMQGRYAEAEKENRAVLAIRERVLGPEHPVTLESRGNLATVLGMQGRYSEAEKEYRAVLAIRERVLGPEHPDTLESRGNLADALLLQGRYAEAEKEHRAVLAIQERVLGPEHPETSTSRNSLAGALQSQGKYAEAEKEHRAVLVILERVLGSEHPNTLMSRNNLATALQSQGKYAEAEKEYRAVLATQERVLGSEHPNTLTSRNNLATALHSQGKHAEAEKEYRAVLAIQERVLGSEHPDVFLNCSNLSLCLEDQGKKAEALQFARRALAGWTRVLGVDHPNTKLAKTQVEDLEQP